MNRGIVQSPGSPPSRQRAPPHPSPAARVTPKQRPTRPPAAVAAAAAAAVENRSPVHPRDRHADAEEQAEAAETGGRVVSAPIERGTP